MSEAAFLDIVRFAGHLAKALPGVREVGIDPRATPPQVDIVFEGESHFIPAAQINGMLGTGPKRKSLKTFLAKSAVTTSFINSSTLG